MVNGFNIFSKFSAESLMPLYKPHCQFFSMASRTGISPQQDLSLDRIANQSEPCPSHKKLLT